MPSVAIQALALLEPNEDKEIRSWISNRLEGNWKQIKGKVKEQWGKLTDDDLTAINGQREQLEGKIQERYGIQKDQVRQQSRRLVGPPDLVIGLVMLAASSKDAATASS